MSEAALNDASLPALQSYQPITFLERGVLVPFTTPLLAGTRARPNERQGLELVIPNPSGGLGVYVMSWNSITAFCNPTLFDRILSERIAAIPSVSPSTIRRVAREIAAEGLAGEEARRTALATQDSEKTDRLASNFYLLMSLIAQVGLFADSPPGQPDTETRARLTVARTAQRLGRSPDWVAAALEALGDVMATVGVVGQSGPTRVPRLMAQLRQTCKDIVDWSRRCRQGDQASYVEMICSAADHSLAMADFTVARAHAITQDVVGMLGTWANNPEQIVTQASRPEWLLDGWEQICHLWRWAGDDACRRAALVEIARLLPVVPKEARSWCDTGLPDDPKFRRRRNIPLNEDWRTGLTVFDLISRNEIIAAAMC